MAALRRTPRIHAERPLLVTAGAQGGERDDQFCQMSERVVQQATGCISGFGSHGLDGMAQQHGQRHDGQDGHHEEQRVRVVLEFLGREHHRHEGQQPKQLVVLNLLRDLARWLLVRF
jgi:hypothetical protein